MKVIRAVKILICMCLLDYGNMNDWDSLNLVTIVYFLELNFSVNFGQLESEIERNRDCDYFCW